MIGEAASLLASLSTDLRHELFIVAGIVNAGEHEVVPHEDAVFVTGGQKGVGAPQSALSSCWLRGRIGEGRDPAGVY